MPEIKQKEWLLPMRMKPDSPATPKLPIKGRFALLPCCFRDNLRLAPG
jgi:hypothetical protein